MRIKLFLFVLMTIFGSARAENGPVASHFSTQMTDSICATLELQGAGSWVIFDLDGTVMAEPQILGRDQWYHSWIQRTALQEGISLEHAQAELRPLYIAIKNVSDVVLLESCLPQIIHHLQRNGVGVFALTGRRPDMAFKTRRLLKSFDIDFDHSTLPRAEFQGLDWSMLPNAIAFDRGIFFTDGADKGVIINHILSAVSSCPHSLQVYDDLDKNVRMFQRSLSFWKIPTRLYHYVPQVFRSPSLVLQVGDIQLSAFVRGGMKGPIMSDKVALQVLQDDGEDCRHLLSSHVIRSLQRPPVDLRK
jgi:hypothetical protein